MKAVVFHEHGGLGKLKYEEVDKPKINANEVLVKVKACALNHLDIWTRNGLPGIKIPLPHILGCDIAGEIEKIGKEVKGVREGESVVVAPGQGCGDCIACHRGEDSYCAKYLIMGLQVNGGYAEYVKVEARHLISISNKYSFEEWAAVPLVFLTAWHMLMNRAQLKAGETVLVHAAGSGIGSAAIQIAKLAGATVYTTGSTPEKMLKAKELGADVTINYKKENFQKEILKKTKKQGVDVVFEHIGPETWEKSLACLGRGGRLVTCGATSGPQAKIDLRYLFMKHLTILGSYMGCFHELETVFGLIEQGKLKPVVDSTYPLKDAVAAQQRMHNRRQFGKIVLIP